MNLHSSVWVDVVGLLPRSSPVADSSDRALEPHTLLRTTFVWRLTRGTESVVDSHWIYVVNVRGRWFWYDSPIPSRAYRVKKALSAP